MFARALRLPRDRVAAPHSSALLGRITVDTGAVEDLLLRSSFPILAALTALTATAALFVWLSAVLAIVAVAGIVVCGGILAGLAHHRAGRPAQTLTAARAAARETLLETLDGLPELRSFGAETRAAVAVDRQLERFAESRRGLARLASRGQSAGILVADLTLLGVVAVAAGLIGSGPFPRPSSWLSLSSRSRSSSPSSACPAPSRL